MILNNLIVALWFLLGAGLANIAPIIASITPGIKNWNTPLDFGLKYKGKFIFGKNKTWRGLLSGIAVAIVTVFIQQYALRAYDTDIVINGQNFTELPPVLLGFLLGSGALIGDAIESFFKRQAGIAPGKSWFPFDQIDYIIGAIIFTWILVPLSLLQYSLLLVTGFIFHLIFSYLGYLLKLKNDPI